MQNKCKNDFQQGKPAQLDEKTHKDMRTHHFKLGTDSQEYATQMKTVHNDWTVGGADE